MNKLLAALIACAAAFAPAPARAARPVLKAVNNGRGVAQKLRRSSQAPGDKTAAGRGRRAGRGDRHRGQRTDVVRHVHQGLRRAHEFVPGLDRRLHVVGLEDPSAFAWLTTKYFTAGLAILMLSMGIYARPEGPKEWRRGPTLCY